MNTIVQFLVMKYNCIVCLIIYHKIEEGKRTAFIVSIK